MPLEEIEDASNEDTSIDNKCEAYYRVKQYIQEASFSQLSNDYEAAKPLVEDIIRKELTGVLGEKITTKILNLLGRESKIAI